MVLIFGYFIEYLMYLICIQILENIVISQVYSKMGNNHLFPVIVSAWPPCGTVTSLYGMRYEWPIADGLDRRWLLGLLFVLFVHYVTLILLLSKE